MAEKKSILKAYRFPIILLCSIVLGSVIGIVFGKDALCLKPLGDLFLNAMYMVVVPLVFFTICSSVASVSSLERLRSMMGWMVLVFIATSCLASLSLLSVLHFYPLPQVTGFSLGDVAGEIGKTASTADTLVNIFTTDDFVNILSRKAMLPMMLFAIFFGVCLNAVGEKAKPVVEAINIISEAVLKMISYIMYYAPIGLCAYFATIIGSYGTNLLSVYLSSLIRGYSTEIIYVFVAMTAYAWFATNGKGVGVFWKNIIEPAVTALGTSSSTASLPVNLNAAEKMRIPKDIAGIVLPVGTAMHKQGSCMYYTIAGAFLFSLYGMPFKGVWTVLLTAFAAVLCSVITSGVPGGAFVGELLLISIYGLPAEVCPVLMTLHILIDALDTVLNVMGGNCAALLVTRFVEGKDWFEKAWSKSEC